MRDLKGLEIFLVIRAFPPLRLTEERRPWMANRRTSTSWVRELESFKFSPPSGLELSSHWEAVASLDRADMTLLMQSGFSSLLESQRIREIFRNSGFLVRVPSQLELF